MSDHDDFNFEPIPGLPEALPAGEYILWQGRPDEVRLGWDAFRMRWIGVYFGVVALWQTMAAFNDFPTRAEAIKHAAGIVLVLAILAIALMWLAAFVGRHMARQTVYTITSKRVVMRFGLAMPMAINIPFTRIDGARLKLNADGSGDIPLKLAQGRKLAFLALWPYARPFKFFNAEPMLRAIPNAQKVAELLGQQLAASAAAQAGTAPQATPVRVVLPASAPRRPASRKPETVPQDGSVAAAS